MIDIRNAENEFLKYTNKFDLKNPNIERKVHHSIRVSRISEEIAKGLNLSDEEIVLAMLIGILHDIGRFEQFTVYKTYNDLKSIDHGSLGVNILTENNYIRKYILDNEYDNIILNAIKNHNQLKIEASLSKKEELFAKIIRDADKIDIIYEATEIFWKDEVSDVEKQKISDEVFKEFKSGVIVENSLKKNNLDRFVGIISFIFDINFNVSLEILERKQYIKKMLDRFNFSDGDTKAKIDMIEQLAERYIENRLKG